jgi:hypothetical protein
MGKPNSASDGAEDGRDVSTRKRIEEAIQLNAAWAPVFGRDEQVGALLREMGEAIAASARIMADLGVSRICMWCDKEDGGSCCGAGIESRYSTVLLLINLLLANRPPTRRLFPDGCFFLGEHGCTLTARDVLCVNYLCSRIQRTLTPEELGKLQSTTGREMDVLFALNETLKKKIAT